LDPHAAVMLRHILERLGDGRRTIVLITHNLSQGLSLANRVAIQVDGLWVFDAPRAAVDMSNFDRFYTERVGGIV
jgi:ABC-type multidrug transport system ATPase subunit